MGDGPSLPGAGLLAVLEALEAGDQQLVLDLLLGGLEDGPRPIGVRCPDCHARFDWPGLLDAHRVHCAAAARRELEEGAA